jgi:antitoxin component YwqK of YwqJK toxin-antitoxin module
MTFSGVRWQSGRGACAAVVLSLVAAVAQAQTGDTKGGGRAARGGEQGQQAVKIEPYKGPPIYLPETAQVVKPKLVTRETLREEYEGTKTLRVERQVAHYSDNNFAADGTYREFHPNGKPFIEGKFKEGRQDGEWTYYFENGQLNRKAAYANGKPNGSWEVFRADGTLAAKRAFKDGLRDGEWMTYDATGKQVLAEEHYANAQPDGVWKTWYPDGKPKLEVTFKNGKRNGLSTDWNSKGEKTVEAEYVDGKLSGNVTRYSADGKKVVQTFKDGKFVSEAKN